MSDDERTGEPGPDGPSEGNPKTGVEAIKRLDLSSATAPPEPSSSDLDADRLSKLDFSCAVSNVKAEGLSA